MLEVYKPDPSTDYLADNAEMRKSVNVAIATTAGDHANTKDSVTKIIGHVTGAEEKAEETAAAATTSRGAAVAEIPPTKQNDAKEVRRVVVLLFELLKQEANGDLNTTVPPVTVPIKPRSKELLKKLNASIGDNLSDTSAVFLYPLVKAAVDDEISEGDLVAKFEAMKGKVHESLLKKVALAIIEQHGDYGKSKDEFKALFDHQSVSTVTHRVDAHGGIDSGPPPLDEGERMEYMMMRDEIDRKAKAAHPGNSEEQLKFTNEMWRDIQAGKFAEVARKMSWSEEDAKKLISHSAREINSVSDERHLRAQYNITDADMAFFESKSILRNFDDYFKVENVRGNQVWVPTELFYRNLQKHVFEISNKLLQRVSGNPESEWDKNFTDFHEGAVVRLIRNRLFAMADDPQTLNRMGGSPDATRPLRDTVFRAVMEVDYEIDARRAMHEVRRFIFSTEPENIAKFLKGFPASRFSFIMNSFDSDLIKLARGRFLQDLDNRIRSENNQLPSDIFASYFKSADVRSGSPSPDGRRVRDDLISQLQTMSKNRDVMRALAGSNPQLHSLLSGPIETWRIERAIALAQAISLVADQRAIEIMVTAEPPPDFSGKPSILTYFGLLARVKRGDKPTGGPQAFFDMPVMELLEVPLDEHQIHNARKEQHNPGKRFRSVHERWRKNPDELMADYIENVFGDVEIKKGFKLRDLLRDYFSYGFLKKGGWRLGSLKVWYKEQFGKDLGKKEGKVDWRDDYDRLATQVGVGARWLFDEDRVKDEIRDYVLRQKFGENYLKERDAAFIDAQWEHIGASYKLHVGGKEMTIEEFVEKKRRCYQGMNFQALLERSPYDFMLTMSTLDKELMATKDVNGTTVSAWSFYFDEGSSAPTLNGAQMAERKRYRAALTRRWGEKNVKHVERIMAAWHETYNANVFMKDLLDDAGDPVLDALGRRRRVIDKKKAQERAYFLMTTATGNVRTLKKPQMTQSDIGTSAEALALGGIFLDNPGGLQRYFHDQGEKFGDEAGQEAKLGSKGFFYALSTRWFEIDQRKMIPNTNEMDLGPFLEHIAVVGEDVFARVWGDPQAYHEVAKGFVILDTMLREEAQGNPKRMDDFMQSIMALAPNEGNEGMHKLMFIVGYLRIKFQQEHHNARDMHPRIKGPGELPVLRDIPGINKIPGIRFPSPLAGNPFLARKDFAYSTLYEGANAKTMTTEEIRMMLHEWEHKTWLPKEGKYSIEWLEEALLVDTKTYRNNEFFPAMITLMTLVYILTQMRKAYEEEFNEQPKKAH